MLWEGSGCIVLDILTLPSSCRISSINFKCKVRVVLSAAFSLLYLRLSVYLSFSFFVLSLPLSLSLSLSPSLSLSLSVDAFYLSSSFPSACIMLEITGFKESCLQKTQSERGRIRLREHGFKYRVCLGCTPMGSYSRKACFRLLSAFSKGTS